MHRIQEMFATCRHFPDGSTLPEIIENGHFGVVQQCDPFMVTALFYGKAGVYAKERTWGNNQSVEAIPEGIRLSFSAQSEMEVVKWILSFGVEAQLLEPLHLRKQIYEELRNALNLYS